MKKTLLLLCFPLLLVSCRENRPVGISLLNGWAVAPGAAAETASDCAGKQFQSIASPVALERFLPEREGIVWIKNEFFVPEALKSVPLSLFLGRVAFSDEVFLNGHPVGRSGDFSLNRYEGGGSRVYALPETVLDPERGNTLLVKLYAGAGGSLALPASILPAEEARRAALLRGFADEGAAAATAMFALLLAFAHLWFYACRGGREKLWFSFACALFAAHLLPLFVSLVPGFGLLRVPYLPFMKWAYGAQCLLVIASAAFVRSFLGRRAHPAITAVIALCALAPAVIASFTGDPRSFFQVRFLSSFLLSVPVIFAVIAIAAEAAKKSAWAGWLLLSSVPLALGAAAEAALLVGSRSQTEIAFASAGFALTLACCAMVMSRRSAHAHASLESYAATLEVTAEERARQLYETDRELEERKKELAAAKKSLADSMNEVAAFQRSLFASDIRDGGAWDLFIVFKPMSSLSGDLYTVHYGEEALAGVGIFHVSGHGLTSGLNAMLAKTIVSRAFDGGTGSKLGAVMEGVNEGLIREIGPSGAYLTGILLRLTDSRVEYVNAGHADLLYKRGKTGATGIVDIGEDDVKGTLLGMDGVRSRYRSVQFETARDDVLLLYTDSFSGSVNAAGEPYGDARIADSLRRAPQLSAKEIGNHLVSDFTRFVWPETYGVFADKFMREERFGLRDDFTMIVLRRAL